jgi:lysozyme
MNPTFKSAGLSILIIILLYFAVNTIYRSSLSSKMYPNFGIRIPNGYSVHGIDVSRYQKNINWPLVQKMSDQGISLQFAIAKCTEGTSIADATYADNATGARANDITFGAYHYFSANISGERQAKYFLRHAKLKANDLAPIIDIEETKGMGNEKIKKELKICLDILEDEYKTMPIIYCNVDFYEAHLGETFDAYPLWAAHYNVAKPKISRAWDIWQHSDKGTVNGIDAKVDFNVINGTSFALKRLCIE